MAILWQSKTRGKGGHMICPKLTEKLGGKDSDTVQFSTAGTAIN